MKRTWIVVISLIVVAALAGIIFWMISSSTQPVQEEDEDQVTEQTTPPDSNQTSPVPQNEPNNTAASEAVEVVIQNQSFVPSEITVKKGTVVTWVNKDDMGHNVISDSGGPAGGLPTTNQLLNKDETYSFTFDAAGEFKYHCEPHPFMEGKVTVTN